MERGKNNLRVQKNNGHDLPMDIIMDRLRFSGNSERDANFVKILTDNVWIEF